MQPGRLTPVNPARYRPFPAYKPTDNQWVNIGLYIRGATGMLAQYKASTETFLVNGFETPVPFYAVAEWRPSSAPPTPPVDTSYSNPLGTGDRRTLITVTATLGLLAGNSTDWPYLVDGGFDLPSTFFAASRALTTADFICFDFGTPRVIQELKWYQDTPESQGTWQLEGSTNGIDWTAIGATFTLGGIITETITTPADNETAWRYYRLHAVSGSCNSAPYTREIEFKISA